MIITELVPLDKKRRKVYIDNQYAFPLYLSEIRRFHIVEGGEISENSLKAIEEILNKRIRERILYLIDSIPRTEKDIRNKLLASGYTEDYVNPVIEVLKCYGYIDDYRYAENFADSLRNGKGNSRRVIEQKLYQKGVSSDIIKEIINNMPDDEMDLIEKALSKKKINLKDLDGMDYIEKQKVYRFLAGKGFSSQSIYKYFGDFLE